GTVKSLSRLTLRDPMACSLQGSSIHGIFQARVLEWDAIAFSAYALDSIKKKKKIYQKIIVKTLVKKLYPMFSYRSFMVLSDI
ncbi:hypothetical protein, partial [Streptococcus pneumoniae]|uniref:hypothetical protein n=1 Tax=Streptococcus pneumoniae TaxID=1313 RepID=UPI000A5718F7